MLPLTAPPPGSWSTAVPTLVDIVHMNPGSGGLPGGAELQTLVNGAGWWALAAALVAMVIGAAAWALGAHAHNYQQTIAGRRAVLVSGVAALVIGAGPAIVSFFYTAGQSVPGTPGH